MGCDGKRAESGEKGSSSLSTVVSIDRVETKINMTVLEKKVPDEPYPIEKEHRYSIPDISEYAKSVDPRFRDSYTPKFVSIGPYFCEPGPRYSKSQSLKDYYLGKLFWRGSPDRNAVEVKLGDAYGEVMQRISDVQGYYAKKIQLEDEELATMLVLDGSFIIEHLINYNLSINEPRLWRNEWDPKQLKMDLMMVANQVPFFILEILFNHVVVVELEPLFEAYCTRSQFLKSMVLWYLGREYNMSVDPKTFTNEFVCHMLHLLHTYGKREGPEPIKKPNVSAVSSKIVSAVSSKIVSVAKTNLCRCRQVMRGNEAKKKMLGFLDLRVFLEIVLFPLRLVFFLIWSPLEMLLYYVVLLPVAHVFWRGAWPRLDSIPSATEVNNMMIKFKKKDKKSGRFWDLRLEGFTLRMSNVSIDGYTSALLFNLVAFEVELSSSKYVSQYADFMQHLIRTTEDVAILRAAGILESNFGSKNLIDFFSELCKGGVLRPGRKNQVTALVKDLQLHYSNPAHLWWGQARTTYLSSPWTIIALSIAAIELIQTLADLRGNAKHKEY